MQVGRRAVVGLGLPFFDRLAEALVVRPEIIRQRCEEAAARFGVERAVARQHFGCDSDASRLAATGQQRAAHIDQAAGLSGGILGPGLQPQQTAAAFGDAGEEIGEKRVRHADSI